MAETEYEFLERQKAAMLRRCPFCDTTKPETVLLTGIKPEARICSDCVAVCVEVLADKIAGRESPRPKTNTEIVAQVAKE